MRRDGWWTPSRCYAGSGSGSGSGSGFLSRFDPIRSDPIRSPNSTHTTPPSAEREGQCQCSRSFTGFIDPLPNYSSICRLSLVLIELPASWTPSSYPVCPALLEIELS